MMNFNPMQGLGMRPPVTGLPQGSMQGQPGVFPGQANGGVFPGQGGPFSQGGFPGQANGGQFPGQGAPVAGQFPGMGGMQPQGGTPGQMQTMGQPQSMGQGMQPGMGQMPSTGIGGAGSLPQGYANQFQGGLFGGYGNSGGYGLR